MEDGGTLTRFPEAPIGCVLPHESTEVPCFVSELIMGALATDGVPTKLAQTVRKPSVDL